MYNKRSTLNYELYNEHINYDPVTGIFTWKKSQSRRYQAGMQIGNIKSRIDKYGVSRDYLYVGFRGEQTPGARVAWLLMTGKEASGNILFKDGNTLNLKFDNLKEADFPPERIVSKNGGKRYKMQADQVRQFGLKRYYGMSMETYQTMLASQNGVCAICKGTETYQPRTYDGPKALSVDHNHTTGEIRGLLCSNCNYMIGHCREDREILLAGVKYLDKHAGRAPAPVSLTVVSNDEDQA